MAEPWEALLCLCLCLFLCLAVLPPPGLLLCGGGRGPYRYNFGGSEGREKPVGRVQCKWQTVDAIQGQYSLSSLRRDKKRKEKEERQTDRQHLGRKGKGRPTAACSIPCLSARLFLGERHGCGCVLREGMGYEVHAVPIDSHFQTDLPVGRRVVGVWQWTWRPVVQRRHATVHGAVAAEGSTGYPSQAQTPEDCLAMGSATQVNGGACEEQRVTLFEKWHRFLKVTGAGPDINGGLQSHVLLGGFISDAGPFSVVAYSTCLPLRHCVLCGLAP
ncbi:hypothetical protein B0J11DRAFT_502033 [Dendryphion nanum]|uniref:Uncharacterized protein n=1 Tax=Dendryphion nanum TaxID=256645 RepID=A0A9P9ED17_9PLEO|nr:hypothetical protein B0J11DRAFT_502033 [Dendryphion nanum]